MQVLGLNAGHDPLDILETFVDAFEVSFPILLDAGPVSSGYRQSGGASPYPLDYVIDQAGNVAYANTEYDPSAMVAVIDALLGNAPAIDTEPEFLPFGAVDVGASAELLLSVANGGAGQLAVHAIATGTDEFSANLSTLEVPPSATRSLLVTFAPTSAGAFVDTLWLASNDPARPLLAVQLHGIGGDGVGVADGPLNRTLALTAAPNPFGDRTAIRLTLPAAGRARLEVFDARGRRVRRLDAGESLAAGEHPMTWDGRDGGGSPLAAGVYFLRLRSGGREAVRKLTLLR